MPAPVNILSSIGSDRSGDDERVSKNLYDASSNRENKASDDRTEAQKSNLVKENSVVLSEMGISIAEGEKDNNEINNKLKKKLRQKQEELDKTEYELAKAKADYIKIMRELVRFPQDFKNKYSLRSRLLHVHHTCEALKEQKKLATKELVKKKDFLENIRLRYEQVKQVSFALSSN